MHSPLHRKLGLFLLQGVLGSLGRDTGFRCEEFLLDFVSILVGSGFRPHSRTEALNTEL